MNVAEFRARLQKYRRIVVPKEICDMLDIKEGDEVEVIIRKKPRFIISNDRIKKLRDLLSAIPAIKDKYKVDWCCYVIQESKHMKDVDEIINYLSEEFPKVNRKDLEFAVKKVFNE